MTMYKLLFLGYHIVQKKIGEKSAFWLVFIFHFLLNFEGFHTSSSVYTSLSTPLPNCVYFVIYIKAYQVRFVFPSVWGVSTGAWLTYLVSHP